MPMLPLIIWTSLQLPVAFQKVNLAFHSHKHSLQSPGCVSAMGKFSTRIIVPPQDLEKAVLNHFKEKFQTPNLIIESKKTRHNLPWDIFLKNTSFVILNRPSSLLQRIKALEGIYKEDAQIWAITDGDVLSGELLIEGVFFKNGSKSEFAFKKKKPIQAISCLFD